MKEGKFHRDHWAQREKLEHSRLNLKMIYSSMMGLPVVLLGWREIEKETSPERGGFIDPAKDFEIYFIGKKEEDLRVWQEDFCGYSFAFSIYNSLPSLSTLLPSRWPGLLSGLALGHWQSPKEMLEKHSFLFKGSCLAGDCTQHPEWERREESALQRGEGRGRERDLLWLGRE